MVNVENNKFKQFCIDISNKEDGEIIYYVYKHILIFDYYVLKFDLGKSMEEKFQKEYEEYTIHINHLLENVSKDIFIQAIKKIKSNNDYGELPIFFKTQKSFKNFVLKFNPDYKGKPIKNRIEIEKNIGFHKNIYLPGKGFVDYTMYKIEENHKGYVYLIKSNNYFKIGKTKNIKQRISSLQTSSATHIELIHTIKTSNYHKIEKELHKKFENQHIKGEWFNLSEEDIEYIKNYNGEI